MYLGNSDIKKTQLKLYYLFLSADGRATGDELSQFESICTAMEIDDETKIEVINECNSILGGIKAGCSEQIMGEITKLLDNETRTVFSFFTSINHDKRAQMETIWTLVNLGYADAEYTEPEKQIVEYLANYWKINADTMAGINDIAETMAALCKQKEWIKTTNKSYDTITLRINEIDQEIGQLAEDIELLIAEADIA